MTRFTPLKNFIDISRKYLVPLETLKSFEQVNYWCNNKTYGKISHILDE